MGVSGRGQKDVVGAFSAVEDGTDIVGGAGDACRDGEGQMASETSMAGAATWVSGTALCNGFSLQHICVRSEAKLAHVCKCTLWVSHRPNASMRATKVLHTFRRTSLILC